MGIIGWFRLGAILLVITVGGYFIWNYTHMQKKIATLEVQVEEQHKLIEVYEKFADVDKTTQETRDEIQKAVADRNIDRIRELYRMLRSHKRIPGSTPSKTNNEDNE